jgi:hypothetical protein
MDGAVDLVAGELRRGECRVRGNARAAAGAGQVEGDALLEGGVAAIARGVVCRGDDDFVEAPIGGRARIEDCARVGAEGFGDGATRSFRDLFEEIEQGGHDAGFGLDFEPGGPGGPRGVAAEDVLFGRRDVALGPVGEGDVHGERERALEFQFQARDCEHLVRQGGDGEVTDADGLELEFGLLAFVEVDGFPRVDLGKVRWQPIAQGLGDVPGPGQPRGIRRAVTQSQPRLGHPKRDMVGEMDPTEEFSGFSGEFLGVGVVTDIPRRRAVVHPHLIAAGALRKEGDEGGVRPQRFGEVFRKAAVVVRGKQRGSVIVLGIVGEDGDGFARGLRHRQHRESGVKAAVRRTRF